MKAKGLPDGARLTFADIERETLSSLLGDLSDALGAGGLQRGDPVYDRLYPAGYSGAVDEAVQAEFRELTEASLREERVTRIKACREELLEAADNAGRVEVDAEGYERWLRVLNDLRLTLGTRLDITEDDEHWQIAADDPRSTAYLLYGWLTEMQDTAVRIALR